MSIVAGEVVRPRLQRAGDRGGECHGATEGDAHGDPRRELLKWWPELGGRGLEVGGVEPGLKGESSGVWHGSHQLCLKR